MKTPLFLFPMLVSLPVSATSFSLEGDAAIDLQTMALTSPEAADVRLRPLTIEAPHGIRFEEGAPGFATAAPIVVGRAFVVRDEGGAEYRLEVKGISGEHRWLELKRVPPPGPVAAPGAGP